MSLDLDAGLQHSGAALGVMLSWWLRVGAQDKWPADEA